MLEPRKVTGGTFFSIFRTHCVSKSKSRRRSLKVGRLNWKKKNGDKTKYKFSCVLHFDFRREQNFKGQRSRWLSKLYKQFIAKEGLALALVSEELYSNIGGVKKKLCMSKLVRVVNQRLVCVVAVAVVVYMYFLRKREVLRLGLRYYN